VTARLTIGTMRSFAPFFLACFELAFAKTHYLFSGAFAGSTVAGLEYEDETDSLSLVRNISLNAVNETGGSKWISLDVSSAHKQSWNDNAV
jgi:carboxy-cis,cis-muconate cyclase